MTTSCAVRRCVNRPCRKIPGSGQHDKLPGLWTVRPRHSLAEVSSASRPLEEADQLTDGVVAVHGMPKGKVVVDFVRIPAAVARLRQVAGLLEIFDELSGRSFRDADGFRYVPEPCSGVGGDARERVRVVGDERPNMVTSTGMRLHEW